MLFRIALHNGRSGPHFRHDTSGTPHVNSWPVVAFSKEEFGGPVPEGDHPVGVPVGLAVLVNADGSGKTEIGKLENAWKSEKKC